MAHDETLAKQVRGELAGNPGFSEKRMFGGVGFLCHGNMACGVLNDDLIVRVGPDAHAEALAQEGVREFDSSGRPMKGWVMLGPEVWSASADLQRWVRIGWAFAAGLPAK